MLNGSNSSNFWGDILVTLGWYVTKEDAQKELTEIYDALLNGEATYQLKYFANVKVKAFGVKIID